jgi:sialic acid synthase SpsE
MGSVAEIAETVETARAAGADDLILLKCTSAYPSTPEDANILTIPNLRATFGCEVGLSDHTMGVGVSIASVAHGATVIEKHFTLARADGGVDSAFSLEPDELASLVTETERAWASLGKVSYGTTSAQEKKSLAFRRSLYISEDIQAGAQLTTENVRAIRPGYGLPTKHLETVLGRRAACDLKAGTAIDWDILN